VSKLGAKSHQRLLCSFWRQSAVENEGTALNAGNLSPNGFLEPPDGFFIFPPIFFICL